jgi:hypothetical protein
MFTFSPPAKADGANITWIDKAGNTALAKIRV